MILWTYPPVLTDDPELVEYVGLLDEFYKTAADGDDEDEDDQPIQLHDGGHNIVAPDGDRIGGVFALTEADGTRVEHWYLETVGAHYAEAAATFSVVQTPEIDEYEDFLAALGSGEYGYTEVRYEYRPLAGVPDPPGEQGTGTLYRVCQTYADADPEFAQPGKAVTCSSGAAKAWLLRESIGANWYDNWVFAPDFNFDKVSTEGLATLTFVPAWADIHTVPEFFQWGIDVKGATRFTRYRRQEQERLLP